VIELTTKDKLEQELERFNYDRLVGFPPGEEYFGGPQLGEKYGVSRQRIHQLIDRPSLPAWWMDLEDAADHLFITPFMVRRAIDDGRIEHIKLRSRYYVDVSTYQERLCELHGNPIPKWSHNHCCNNCREEAGKLSNRERQRKFQMKKRGEK